MKQRTAHLLSLIIISLFLLNGGPVYAVQTIWTEKKVSKVSLNAEKAATRHKWSLAIRHGEKMLTGTVALYGEDSPRYVNRLKTLNRYYDKANRLGEIPQRIETAYILSKKYFRPNHNTALISRLLYYKHLVSQKDYPRAIPVVIENISSLTDSQDDQFRKLHYLTQLHGLYGLTERLKIQEKTLLELLDLNQALLGSDVKDNIKIIMNLAKNYCLQKKDAAFNQLITKYNLKYTC